MDILTAADLRKLAEVRGPNCVSIYFETHRTGKETRQDPLRLKGRLDDVEQQLTAADMRSVERRKLLAPAKQLLDDETFWSDQSDGLCILLNPDLIRTFRLPRSFPDLAIVGSRFHLTPLLPLVVDNVEYHILAFSPSRVRFFTATRDTVESRAVEALPKSIEELEQYIETERSLQFHTRAAPASSGKRAGVFHGQGVGTDDTLRKTRLLEYCQMIDKALRPILSSSRSPLVLAADEALLPLYRKATSYRHLVDQSVTGNPDLLSERKLRDAAWQIVSQRNGVHRTERLAAFHEAAAQDQASADIEQILPAAASGRVRSILVADQQHCWGLFDERQQQVETHTQRQAGDEDLVNAAASIAWLKGADVCACELNEMPYGAPLAALYRY